MKAKHPKTRAAEQAPRKYFEESKESKFTRLHIHVLSYGRLKNKYQTIWDKKPSKLTEEEQEIKAFLCEYFDKYPMMTDSKKGYKPKQMLGHWQKRILTSFCEFIDNPLHSHHGNFRVLHYSKSKIKALQHKQRQALVEVVTTLFTQLDVETLSVRKYADNPESQILDGDGKQMMRGITHYSIRNLYQWIWGKPISKTKYFDTLNMLKLVGFFDCENCYLSNSEAEIRRAELAEEGATLDEINKTPSIKSEASYKWFTPQFIAAFGLAHHEDMIKAKEFSIQNRIKKGLSNMFATFSPSSDSFWTKKRKAFLKRLGNVRYPQGALGFDVDCTPPEVAAIRH